MPETKEKPKASIPELLKQLERSTDPKEKRNIRAKLRSAGHNGGLPREKKVKAEKVAEKPKGRRAKAAA